MHDVAKLAGVSAKTVSRVFNDDPHVSPATRDRVNAVLSELKYVPNMMARTFREGKASVIGIAVPDIADPFFAAIIGTIDQVAQKHHYTIAVTSLGEDPDREREVVEALLRRQIDGFIIAPIAANQAYLAPWLTRVPMVFVDREPANLAADSFIEDDLGGANSAVSHLLERGHRRIAFVGDSEKVVTTRRRLEGYRYTLREAGIEPDPGLVLLIEPQDASAAVRRALELPDPLTAIFSSNSRTSQQIFPALQRLAAPGVALVSFGDFPMASALHPSVTVIDQNPTELGRVAADRLFSRQTNPTRRYKRRNVLDVSLIERESSAFML